MITQTFKGPWKIVRVMGIQYWFDFVNLRIIGGSSYQDFTVVNFAPIDFATLALFIVQLILKFAARFLSSVLGIAASHLSFNCTIDIEPCCNTY